MEIQKKQKQRKGKRTREQNQNREGATVEEQVEQERKANDEPETYARWK